MNNNNNNEEEAMEGLFKKSKTELQEIANQLNQSMDVLFKEPTIVLSIIKNLNIFEAYEVSRLINVETMKAFEAESIWKKYAKATLGKDRVDDLVEIIEPMLHYLGPNRKINYLWLTLASYYSPKYNSQRIALTFHNSIARYHYLSYDTNSAEISCEILHINPNTRKHIIEIFIDDLPRRKPNHVFYDKRNEHLTMTLPLSQETFIKLFYCIIALPTMQLEYKLNNLTKLLKNKLV